MSKNFFRMENMYETGKLSYLGDVKNLTEH